LAAPITIQSLSPAIQVLVVLLLFVFLVRRRGRAGPLGVAALVAALVGSVLLVVGSVERYYFLSAAGIGLLGVGWLAAVRLVPTERLAVLTLLLGMVALLEAVDSGILLLPSPIGLVWVRVLLEIVWVVWTAIALTRRTRIEPARADPKRETTETEPNAAPPSEVTAATT
jgi:hypothetical protein